MDNFEKIIAENAKKDLYEPFEGHTERFLSKLDKKKKRNNLSFMRKIAAISIVILAIGSLLHQYAWKKDPISEEYYEMQLFYTAAINSSINKIEILNEKGKSDRQINEILSELKEFDKKSKVLIQNFKAAPNDERILNSMILHYRSYLEALEKVNIELESINERNINSYEKFDI